MTGADFAEIEVTISNAQGMHGRPSSRFVRIASRYEDTEIVVVKDGMEVNGKSIFGLMMLAAGPGTLLRIRAQGPGADKACAELKALIDSQFGEEGVA
jgi:phosphocarrier protein